MHYREPECDVLCESNCLFSETTRDRRDVTCPLCLTIMLEAVDKAIDELKDQISGMNEAAWEASRRD